MMLTGREPSGWASDPLDSITLEILWSRLIAAVDEAAVALVRTSFSTLAREANDLAAVLLDPRGQLVAESTGAIPAFLGTVPRGGGAQAARPVPRGGSATTKSPAASTFMRAAAPITVVDSRSSMIAGPTSVMPVASVVRS